MDEARLWALALAGDVVALAALLRELRRRPPAPSALQNLTQLPPLPDVWLAITNLLDAFKTLPPSQTRELLQHADQSLSARWPSTARIAPASWVRALTQGQQHPGWPLCRVANFGEISVSVTAAQRLIDTKPSPFAAMMHLDLSHKRWFADTWRRLFGSDALTHLKTLNLHDVQFSAELLVQLGASPHLDGLEALSLTGTQLEGDRGELALHRWRLPGLKHVSLARVGLLPGAAAGLSAWRPGLGFESLNLSGNRLDDVALYRLASGGWEAKIQRLDVSGNPLGADAGLHLCDWGALSELQWLNLSDTGLSAQTLSDFLLSPAVSGLRYLDISNNPGLGEGGAEELSANGLERLEHMSLARTRLSVGGLEAVLGGGWVRGLKSLDLSGNPLGDEGVRALARSTTLKGLEVLGLADCDIGPVGAEALTAAEGFGGLQHLNMSHNRLGNRGALVFAGDCSRLALKTLDLTQNRVWRDAAKALAESKSLTGVEVKLDLPKA